MHTHSGTRTDVHGVVMGGIHGGSMGMFEELAQRGIRRCKKGLIVEPYVENPRENVQGGCKWGFTK